jgi:Na+-transporting NADH:ubiquinone oxidoreductase subunit NqrC
MKKLILILVVTVVAGIVGSVIYFQLTAKADKEQADEQMARFDTEMRAKHTAMQEDIDESKAKLITIKLGAVAGDEFRLCKISPPKLEENRAKCEKFEAYLKKLDAEEKQHPSW